MELIIALAMKFWQWSILIGVVIITLLINLLDKKRKSNLQFSYTEMPQLKPIAIKIDHCQNFVASATISSILVLTLFIFVYI